MGDLQAHHQDFKSAVDDEFENNPEATEDEVSPEAEDHAQSFLEAAREHRGKMGPDARKSLDALQAHQDAGEMYPGAHWEMGDIIKDLKGKIRD